MAFLYIQCCMPFSRQPQVIYVVKMDVVQIYGGKLEYKA